MLLHGAVVFLSAFLLFLVQPLMARVLLPVFGGAVAVWTTCLVFFQTALLLGYGYSHGMAARLSPARQAWVHGALLALSWLSLPLDFDRATASSATSGSEGSPAFSIVLRLALAVGLPYLVLSTTGPLLQSWFARESAVSTGGGRSPYRLYALSNLGSMLALLGYPILFEPQLALRGQATAWTLGYGAFTLLAALGAWRQRRFPALVRSDEAAAGETPARGAGSPLLWLALSATGTAMLLATTNHLCADVASVPLLWVAPLALYLATFILCFDSERAYRRWIYLPLLAIALGAVTFLLGPLEELALGVQIGVYLTALFACCMVCHGELARAKPPARDLTRFYLIVAVGGALGSALVAFVAPALFPAYWEYPLGLATTAALTVGCAYRRRDPNFAPHLARALAALGAAACLLLVGVLGWRTLDEHQGRERSWRNFYGTLHYTLEERSDFAGPHHERTLWSGTTRHGRQFDDERRRSWPTAYYGFDSGIGLALRHFVSADQDTSDRPPGLEVGVVGLGAGTLATYAREGDSYRFYELNPQVVEAAEEEFTFLARARSVGADLDIVLGDARISLARERSQGAQPFDVLALDAFTSDSIPLHLLTREAFELYFHRLKQNGVLAVHISNRHLDLEPILRRQAAEAGVRAEQVLSIEDNLHWGTSTAFWILMTRNTRFLDQAVVRAMLVSASPAEGRAPLWTDDFASLWPTLGKKSVGGRWPGAPRQGFWLIDERLFFTSASAIAIQEELRELYVDSGDGLILSVLTIEPTRHPHYVRGDPAHRARTVRTHLLQTLFADDKSHGYAVVLLPTLNEALVVACRMRNAAHELEAMRRDLDAVWTQLHARGPLTPNDPNTSSAIEAYIARTAAALRATRGMTPR